MKTNFRSGWSTRAAATSSGKHPDFAPGGSAMQPAAASNTRSQQLEREGRISSFRFRQHHGDAGQSTNQDQVITQSAGLKADMVRLGLNYRFGGADAPAASPRLFDSAAQHVVDLEHIQLGIRCRHARILRQRPRRRIKPSRRHADQSDDTVVSRLLWSNMNSLAGETYARVDHSSGFFVKGYLGAGGLFNGILNDEDFPADPSLFEHLQHGRGKHRLRHRRRRLYVLESARRQARRLCRL